MSATAPGTPLGSRRAAPGAGRGRSQLWTASQTFVTNIGVGLVSLLNVLIVSRGLGPPGRGGVVLLTTIAVLTGYASTLGVQEAMVNIAGTNPGARRALATNSLLLAALLGGTGAAVVLVLSNRWPAITGHASHGRLWLALGSVPVLIVGNYLMRLVQADYRFSLSNAAWITGPLVSVVANGSLYALGVLSVGSAVAVWVGGQILTTAILVVGVGRSPGFGRPRLALASQTVRFGVKIHPATVFGFANYRLDQWLLGALGNRTQLGLYSVAVSWSEALFMLPTAVMFAQRPHLVRSSASDAARTASSGFRLSMLATAPLALGMIVASPLLCTVIFGEKFAGSTTDLRTLALGAFGIVSLKVLGNALTAQGRPLLQTAATGVAFLCTVAFDLLLIPSHGDLGASIASVLAYTVGGVAVVAIFTRVTHIRSAILVPRLSELRPYVPSLRSYRSRRNRGVTAGTPAGGGLDATPVVVAVAAFTTPASRSPARPREPIVEGPRVEATPEVAPSVSPDAVASDPPYPGAGTESGLHPDSDADPDPNLAAEPDGDPEPTGDPEPDPPAEAATPEPEVTSEKSKSKKKKKKSKKKNKKKNTESRGKSGSDKSRGNVESG